MVEAFLFFAVNKDFRSDILQGLIILYVKYCYNCRNSKATFMSDKFCFEQQDFVSVGFHIVY